MKRTLIFGLAYVASSILYSQWMENGNFGFNENTEFIGNSDNVGLTFRTHDRMRMRLYRSQTNTINGYGGVGQNGFVGISDQPLFFDSSVGAFSRLHLVDRGSGTVNFGYYAQQLGFRRWQRNGVTFTGNSDQGYVGQKYLLDGNNAPVYDMSDMVLQWSNDAPGENGPDRLRFLFTSSPDGVSNHGSRSEEGLEAMRFTPVDYETINAGLGDFYRGNLLDPMNVIEPTERLDILNGRLRIRELPLVANQNETLDRYMVVDNSGVVQWRNLPPASLANCEWYRNTGSKFVLSGTGAPGTATCPDRAWRYGIGTASPNFKFDVYHNDNDRLNSGGINSSYLVNDAATSAFGMQSTVTGSYFALGYGLRASVSGAGYAVGVEGGVTVNSASIVGGQASSMWGRLSHTSGTLAAGYALRGEVQTSVSATNMYGSYGNAYGYGSANIANMHGAFGRMQLDAGTVLRGYGVKGESFTGTGTLTDNYGLHGYAYGGVNNYSVYGQLAHSGTVNWSGFFVGPISASGMSFPSDENLKSEVQDLTDPVALLMQLQPKSYTYRREEFPQMGLPEGLRYGFIAQEVQQVFPQFVTPSHQPQEVDSLGNETSAAVDYLALSTSDIRAPLITC